MASQSQFRYWLFAGDNYYPTPAGVHEFYGRFYSLNAVFDFIAKMNEIDPYTDCRVVDTDWVFIVNVMTCEYVRVDANTDAGKLNWQPYMPQKVRSPDSIW